MPRETKAQKAARLLTEHRVAITAVTDDVIVGRVRGTGAEHDVIRDPAGWSCTCPNLSECSHIIAVKTVTLTPPRRRTA